MRSQQGGSAVHVRKHQLGRCIRADEGQLARRQVDVKVDHHGMDGGCRKVQLNDMRGVAGEDGDAVTAPHTRAPHVSGQRRCPLKQLSVRQLPPAPRRTVHHRQPVGVVDRRQLKHLPHVLQLTGGTIAVAATCGGGAHCL